MLADVTLLFRLKKCGVHCKVVLDGAYDGSEIKRTTVMQRMREQAKGATRISTVTQKKNMVMPLFAKGSFDAFVACQGKMVLIQYDHEVNSFL